MVKDIIKLNFNENTFAKEIFSDKMREIYNYPSINYDEFKRELAKYYDIEIENLYFGNGIDELIQGKRI